MKDWRQWIVARPALRSMIFKAELKCCRGIISDIKPWMGNHKIIDVGTGSGVLAHLLQESGLDVDALDIRDATVTDKIHPVIYDGKVMPFQKNEFDTALIIYVLHHTMDADQIIAGAAHIARQVIILEDVITDKLNSAVTKILDSLVNFEFFGHPHSNRTHEGWLKSFNKMGIDLLQSQDIESSLWLTKPINHKVYILNTENYGD